MLFVRNEKYKLIATVIAIAVFLFFWINGPVLKDLVPIQVEVQLTEYARPFFVGEGLESQQEVRTVEEAEVDGFGHSLILDKPKETSSSGILSSTESDETLHAQGAAMLKHAARLFPDKEFDIQTGAELVYLVERNKHYTYFESIHIPNQIQGYAGPINVGLLVDEHGKVASVNHISSLETESYLQKIQNAGYYDQYHDLQLPGSYSIDAVSGATITSNAIAATTTEVLDHAIPDPLENLAGIDGFIASKIDARLSNWWILHAIVIGLIFFYGYQKRIKKNKRSIIVLSILSVLYIGFFLNSSFTYISFIHPFIGTSVSSLVGIYAFYTILGSIWGKNTYCKYVCPFGNAQRLLLQIGSKKIRRNFFIPNKWIKRIRGGLALGLIIGVLVGLRSWSNFELFPDLFGLELASVWLAVSLISVVATMVYPMIWCRLLCPTGSVLDFVSDAVNYKFKK